jgi:hypothetical protein
MSSSSSSNLKHKEDSADATVNKRARGAVCDRAATLGYAGGDRLQVAWVVSNDTTDINDKNDDTDNNIDDAANNNDDEAVWWGAELLPWTPGDETLRQGPDVLAVRRLEYDPYPEAGFLESSLERVVFLDEGGRLQDLSTGDVMEFQRESAETEAAALEQPVQAPPEALVQATLQTVLAKYADVLQTLPAAQQASISDHVSRMKERVMVHLEEAQATSTSTDRLVTKEDMHEILSKVGQEEQAARTER